jgi:hypothetical protein
VVIKQISEREPFEVFAWGHGFVGARPTLDDAWRLAQNYEGARIITYEEGDFRVVAEVGRYQVARSRDLDR